MKNKDINSIARLTKDDNFKSVFRKLSLEEELNLQEKEFILASSLILFNIYNNDNRFKSYFRLGFYIILKYGNKYKDYKPLYEVSLQLGFYPLIDYILKKDNQLLQVDTANRILDVLTYTSYQKNFQSSDNYIEAFEQKKSRENLVSNTASSQLAYIAPTSYGKSSIIRQFINTGNYNKIAVIVPTKSLLIQTYYDIKNSINTYKIILHDDMFNNESKFIGILTQERASRLLVKNRNLSFDILFIDEAHKLLERDSRSYIISRCLQLNYKRNTNQKLIYLSPLIEDVSNLITKKTNLDYIYSQYIKHDFKSFEINLFDEGKAYFFDKFLNEEYILNNKISYFEYVLKNSLSKNFIYNSRPIRVEEFALELSKNIKSTLETTQETQKIIDTLSKEVHPSFYINSCLKKGIIYIHAKIPNIIKEYLESCFKDNAQIKYIVANKVILEGINLPIETIFITTNGSGNKNEKLKIKDLINLVGRANRLNYVFTPNKTNLEGLVSKIHFMNHQYYQGKNDIRTSIKRLREYSFTDVVLNPLLKNYNIDDLIFNGTKEQKKERKKKQENEDTQIKEYSDYMLEIPTTFFDKIKKYFIENSLYQFFSDLDIAIMNIEKNIIDFEFSAQESILEIIFEILLVNNLDNISDFELERLKNKAARNYYNYFLSTTQKQHLNQRINSTVEYLQNKSTTSDPFLYIGTGYGEVPRQTVNYNSEHYSNNVYVDLRKSKEKLVNLAIVKLKIEEDFISYKLNSLIVFLFDFQIVSEEYYYTFLYGTNNKKTISLARFGLSISIIAKIEKDNKLSHLDFDSYGNLIINNEPIFNEYLKDQPELFRFEVRKFIN